MRNVIVLNSHEGVRAFLFDYGVCVLFHYDYESEKRLIDLLRKYTTNPLEQFIEEELWNTGSAVRPASASATT